MYQRFSETKSLRLNLNPSISISFLKYIQLRAAHPIKEMIDRGRLKIVGGRYDLDTGRVTMLIE